MQTEQLLESMRGGLIVSCQAPPGSPLHDPYVIRAMALTAEQQGAVGVRLSGATHIAAAHEALTIPIIGLEKVVTPGSDVYITPTFAVAERIAQSGATMIAVDATQRARPNGETIELLLKRIRQELQLPVMADVATFAEGVQSAEMGANVLATTLCGYTQESAGASLPAFALVEQLAKTLRLPVICEGGIATPEDVRRAFDSGAFAVVVGTAITGISQLVKNFIAATTRGQA